MALVLFFYYIVYLAAACTILLLLLKKMPSWIKYLSILIAVLIPTADVIFCEAMYAFKYKHEAGTYITRPIVSRSYAKQGPFFSGSCGIVSMNATSDAFSSSRSDEEVFEKIEFIRNNGIYAYERSTGKISKKEKMTSRYLSTSHESRFLTLVHRTKRIVDTSTGEIVAEYKYTARLKTGIPFFTSLTQRSLLKPDKHHRDFCYFEGKVISSSR